MYRVFDGMGESTRRRKQDPPSGRRKPSRKGTAPKLRKRPLTIELILAWADAHHRRTGEWPQSKSGPVVGAPGENWSAINNALHQGCRGFPGGSSLLQLLAKHRGVIGLSARSELTISKILKWADAYHKRTGRWPSASSGPVDGAEAETWSGIDSALRAGRRGLSGDTCLAALLAEHRGALNCFSKPKMTVARILEWADRHHARTGQWPSVRSGPVVDAPGHTWVGINGALRRGSHGLPGGGSLSKLLAERGRAYGARCRLTEETILSWADAHFERTGQWPRARSGVVEASPAETWSAINYALKQGRRGLPGGTTLTRLLNEHGRTQK